MSTDLQGNASFAEVYHFLKGGGDEDTFQCFRSLFSVALLLFPAFMGKEVALITNMATGATLAGAGVGAIVGNAAKSAFSFFKRKDHGNYKTRYQQMQVAQVILVYAAYFDTISQYLPNENGEIVLSPNLKKKITQNALKSYLKGLEKRAQQSTGMHRLLETSFALPDQTEEFSQYEERLEKFYTAMNDEFIIFFEKTKFWEELDSDPDVENLESNQQQRKYFFNLLQKLPKIAVSTYVEQYFELSREFPDFAIWANRKEHNRIESKIDIGFQEAAERLRQLADALPNPGSRAAGMLAHYHKRYAGYVMDPILEYDTDNSFEDIVLPEKQEIFIPQAFQVLSFQPPMRLEREETWSESYHGEDIGQYVSSILRHPKYCGQPMLVLGLPGAGKTLLCHMLAAQLLSTEYFVIIIRLRDTNADDTIIQQVNAQIERDLGEECTWNDFRNASLDKPILLIFDGYDELLQASGKTYSDYLRKIAAFQAEELRVYDLFVRCIVTSRVTLIDKAAIPRNSLILRLCDFDDTRVRIWCDIWNEKNTQHFAAHSLKKFEVAPGGKVKELARQPLLLLMLALYEMNGGDLQEQDNISRAKLYYQLIRDFVVRERKKDSDFNHKESKAQKKTVEEDFLHLSIAALGMYNRKKLFIQSRELDKDLTFLTQGETAANAMDERALSKSDQLIGSFFFIHMSSTPTGEDTVKVSAYEFLHNTFGEFLTAYYILNTVFQVIRRHRLEEENDEAFSWTKPLRKKWYAGLAYAPLFTRPVVLNMIHELSDVFLQNSKLDAEAVRNALDTRFHEELCDIISGESFGALQEILNMQENPYKHPELMVHIAVYSVNLILLRATICGDSFTFTESLGSADVWQKLTHIWRYAFSEEELVSLSCLVALNHSDGAYALTYIYNEGAADQAGTLSKLSRLLRVSEVLGDDAALAIFNSVRGELTPQINKTIVKERLQLKTRYALNRLSECLTNLRLSRQDHAIFFEAMEELRRCCSDEGDIIGLIVYCTLLQTLAEQDLLSKQDVLALVGKDYLKYVEKALRSTPSSLLRELILKELLGCTKYLPDTLRWSILEECFVYYGFVQQSERRPTSHSEYDPMVQFILETLKLVLEDCRSHPHRRPPKGLCFKFFRRLSFHDLWWSTPQMVQICRLLNQIGYQGERNEIIIYFFHDIDSKDTAKRLIQNMNRNPALAGVFIDCCYYVQRDHNFGRWESTGFYRFAQYMLEHMKSIEALLPDYEESFYHLLCLFCNDAENLWRYEKLSLDEAERIVQKHGEMMSIHTLKKLAEYGQKVGYAYLERSIERLLQFD